MQFTRLSKNELYRRKKLSETHKGKLNWMYGKTHSEAARLKISQSKKGKRSPFCGKHHTLENREKLRMYREGKTYEELFGKKKAEELKIRHSNALTGRKLSEEHRKRIANGLRGRKLSFETKEKMSKSRKGIYIGEKHPLYGKMHSEETRHKISNSLRELPQEKKEERCRKIREKAIGRKHSEETKNKISINNACYWKGKKLSEKTRRLLSIARLGKKFRPHSRETKEKISRANKGRKFSDETIQKMRENNKGKCNPFYGRKHTKEEIQKMMLSACKKPNRIEQKFIMLFNECGLPYKFVGDGSILIGNKCPDFINVDNNKNLIEIFGDYWHTKIKNKKRWEEEKDYYEYYKNKGFKVLILWVSDIKKITDKDIIDKIKNFEAGC